MHFMEQNDKGLSTSLPAETLNYLPLTKFIENVL